MSVMCGAHRQKKIQALEAMLSLGEAVDQRAMANSVHWYGHIMRRDGGHVCRIALEFEAEGDRKQAEEDMEEAGYGRSRLWKKQVMEEAGYGRSRLWKKQVMEEAGYGRSRLWKKQVMEEAGYGRSRIWKKQVKEENTKVGLTREDTLCNRFPLGSGKPGHPQLLGILQDLKHWSD